MGNDVVVVNQIQLPQEDQLELVRLPRFVLCLVTQVEINQCYTFVIKIQCYEVLIIPLVSAGIFH